MRDRLIVRWLAAAVLLALCGCSNTGNSGASSTGSNSSSSENTAPAPPPPLVIPAGTTLTVTIDQTVSTKTSTPGERFAASLAEPVTVDGNEVLRTGTKASGTVTEAGEAGHIKGSAALAITLDSLTVGGQKYRIETSTYSEATKGRGKRTAIGAGGGAAAGAIIGALAGGGKGAAIGALAGGGAGTAGAAYTGNRDITIPAETRVHFKLTRSVSISQ
jgi:hypothetical protein